VKNVFNRISFISERVFRYYAKDEDIGEFARTFKVLRLKVKDLKKKWAKEAMESLKKTLIKDLKEKGYDIVEFNISLGQYRGSQFITSAKLSVNMGSEDKAKKLAGYLQKYSPKFSLKEFNKETGVASYNIR
jgi:hypothetical protein